jgi:hypothetical protein
MKLISGSIFCCLIFINIAHASDQKSKKWSWPVATALGLKKSSAQTSYQTKTILPTKPSVQNPLTKKPSDEWDVVTHDEIHSSKRTPSPVVRDSEDAQDGSIIDHPNQTNSRLAQYPKLSDILRVDIMIPPIPLKSIKKESLQSGVQINPLETPNPKKAVAQFQLTVPAEQENRSHWSTKTQGLTPSPTGQVSPDIKLVQSIALNRHSPKLTKELQREPLYDQGHQEPISNTLTPVSHIMELENNLANSTTSQPPSLWNQIIQGCCPCLPAPKIETDSTKKKNDPISMEKIKRSLDSGDLNAVEAALDYGIEF